VEFCIIPDFLNALSKLSKTDQKGVRNTINAIVTSYDGSGSGLHKIKHPSSTIFSYRVNRSIRIIVHRQGKTTTMLYVDHHDDAYSWVERRKFVTIDTAVRIISVKESETEETEHKTKLDNPILATPSNIEQYKQELSRIYDDDKALEFIERLPINETAKYDLLEEFVVSKSDKYSIMPQYLVKVLEDDEELAEALKYPLDLWRVFLHPVQTKVVSLPHDSSRFITGGPGTGKTVCLVHRIKRVIQYLGEDQQVLLITYKEQLSGYIRDMMSKIGIDISRIMFTDVTEMTEASVINVTSRSISRPVPISTDIAWKNCFVIANNKLYYRGDRLIQLTHIFADEYQDFRGQQLDIIHQLTEYVPFTICVDYSQAIYRPPRKKVRDTVSVDEVNIVELSYCYRLNDQIIRRLRNVLLAAQVMANFASGTRYQFEVIPREEKIIDSLAPAVFGPPPKLFKYKSEEDLNAFLTRHVSQVSEMFSEGELVVTTFFPEISIHPQEDIDYRKELLPEPIQHYYRYIYTLKGLEWKAGIVVLDDVICNLLNLNRSLFVNQVPEGFKGSKDNIKRMFNLLYVALSRFRDYLCICYPTKYALALDGMFE